MIVLVSDLLADTAGTLRGLKLLRSAGTTCWCSI
jgi:hypothetical protein